MFTYQDFISEAEQLAEEAKHLAAKSDQDASFRRWKRRVEDILHRIEAEGYKPQCAMGHRRFNRVYSDFPHEREAAFAEAVEETVIELETMVSSFKKFGPPSRKDDQRKQGASVREKSSTGPTFHISGGQVQIGDNNVQNIVNALRELQTKIDSADALPEQKQQAAGLLRSLIAHPRVTSVLGGLAGSIL
jgi:F0F1-type ATP synthase epsilon subunit